MEKERIGKVFTYFSKAGVAGIKLTRWLPVSRGYNLHRRSNDELRAGAG